MHETPRGLPSKLHISLTSNWSKSNCDCAEDWPLSHDAASVISTQNWWPHFLIEQLISIYRVYLSDGESCLKNAQVISCHFFSDPPSSQVASVHWAVVDNNPNNALNRDQLFLTISTCLQILWSEIRHSLLDTDKILIDGSWFAVNWIQERIACKSELILQQTNYSQSEIPFQNTNNTINRCPICFPDRWKNKLLGIWSDQHWN